MRLKNYLVESEIKVLIKNPNKCTPDEKDRFIELAESGGQNSSGYVNNLFNDLLWVGLLYANGEIKAISSIKKGRSYAFEMANVEGEYKKHQNEVGFSFTDPDSRGLGYNKILKKELFKKVSGGIFCTIRVSNVASITANKKLGFKQIGDIYQGIVEPVQLMVLR